MTRKVTAHSSQVCIMHKLREFEELGYPVNMRRSACHRVSLEGGGYDLVGSWDGATIRGEAKKKPRTIPHTASPHMAHLLARTHEGALRNSGSAVPIFWIITLPEVMRNMSRPSKRGYGATAYRTNCGWVHSPTREGHALRPRHLHCIERPLGERKMRTVVSRRHWASS